MRRDYKDAGLTKEAPTHAIHVGGGKNCFSSKFENTALAMAAGESIEPLYQRNPDKPSCKVEASVSPLVEVLTPKAELLLECVESDCKGPENPKYKNFNFYNFRFLASQSVWS